MMILASQGPCWYTARIIFLIMPKLGNSNQSLGLRVTGGDTRAFRIGSRAGNEGLQVSTLGNVRYYSLATI